MKYILIFNIALAITLYGNSIENTISGFDTINNIKVSPIKEDESKSNNFYNNLSGELNFHTLYTIQSNKFNSLKGSIFLDYSDTISDHWKIKLNGNYYYDLIYDMDPKRFSQEEKAELKDEFYLNEAYISGKITKDLDILDIKIGRQIVAWGDSDTIRITDILNPLDNTRPGLSDIEYIRLPLAMIKIDYFINNWNIVPIIILEQDFSKRPPYGSPFYPMDFKISKEDNYNDITYGFKLSNDFHGGSFNLYTARIYDDEGYVEMIPPQAVLKHEKITMIGSSESFTWGSWLFKNENAYLKDLKYSSVNEKTFSRFDVLLGVEYYGYENTTISYDIASRRIKDYDLRLLNEVNPLYKNSYHHALRINKNFMNETLHLNYLLTINGNRLFQKSGGLQKFWGKYKIDDSIAIEVGTIDYMGGTDFYNKTENQDAVFANFSYNF